MYYIGLVWSEYSTSWLAEVIACRKLPCALGAYCFSTATWISIYFSVYTLHTILTYYSYKFGLYLIAPFHLSLIFFTLQDPELASKTRFLFSFRVDSKEFLEYSVFLYPNSSERKLCISSTKTPENLRSVQPKLIQIWCQRCTSWDMNLERKLKQQKCLGFTKINNQLYKSSATAEDGRPYESS